MVWFSLRTSEFLPVRPIMGNNSNMGYMDQTWYIREFISCLNVICLWLSHYTAQKNNVTPSVMSCCKLKSSASCGVSQLSLLFDDCAYVCWYVSISGHHHQCRASSNGYQHGSHSGASATSSNYHSYQQQQSYAKQQEEYARKLYTLRYALKSDVFMGYGKSKCETALLLANSSFSWANLCAWSLLSSLFFDLILFLVHILLFKNILYRKSPIRSCAAQVLALIFVWKQTSLDQTISYLSLSHLLTGHGL